MYREVLTRVVSGRHPATRRRILSISHGPLIGGLVYLGSKMHRDSESVRCTELLMYDRICRLAKYPR